MLQKNFSFRLLSPISRNNPINSLILNSNNSLNNNTEVQKGSSNKGKILKFKSKNLFNKIKSKSKEKKQNNTRIYLKLDIKDDIEKIVKDEEKKKYFNQEFHLNKNLNREELKRRIGNKTLYEEISKTKSRKSRIDNKNKRPRTSLKAYGYNTSRNLININKRLVSSFKSKGEKEIEESKKNYEMVNEFLKKMEAERWNRFNEMEIKFLKNKSEKKNNSIVNINLERTGKNKKDKKRESLKINESNFIKFKRQSMIKENKLIKQKSQLFDSILKYNFGNFYLTKYGDTLNKFVNYRLLNRTILMRNLMSQMKIAVFKDETLNVLRSFQSPKLISLNDDKFNFGIQNNYTNQTDNIFFRGNIIRHKPIPHFLKVKFNNKTLKKFGEVNDSYFGLPV